MQKRFFGTESTLFSRGAKSISPSLFVSNHSSDHDEPGLHSNDSVDGTRLRGNGG